METESIIFDKKTLNEFKKDHLVDLILELQKEKNELRMGRNTIAELGNRVTEIERSHYLYLQYGRRESVEITGIPENIDQKDLEGAVIDVYNAARITVHGAALSPKDISACHRIGKKGKTIVRFVNRKFAMEGLINGRNLKGTNLYGTPIYINNSFCREFSYYGYVIRKLKANSLIDGYKIKHGVYYVKTLGNVKYDEVSHINDFSKFNLDISPYPRHI